MDSHEYQDLKILFTMYNFVVRFRIPDSEGAKNHLNVVVLFGL